MPILGFPSYPLLILQIPNKSNFSSILAMPTQIDWIYEVGIGILLEKFLLVILFKRCALALIL